MEAQIFDNVFDALTDTPAEAANMKARAQTAVGAEGARAVLGDGSGSRRRRLGITRPRLKDLMRGKLGKFSLDALVNLTSAAGLTLEIKVADAA